MLTSELTDLLIEKVYVFPDNRIEIVYKVHDLFEFIHLIEQQKIHMGQRIVGILAFFLCQWLIVLHQRRKRNMYPHSR